MTVNYTNRLLSIYYGDAGSFVELESFCDVNSKEQGHNWEALLTGFEVAITQGSIMFGDPSTHLLKNDTEAEDWKSILKSEFEKLTAWNIGQSSIFVIFLYRSPDNDAMKMFAGLTH